MLLASGGSSVLISQLRAWERQQQLLGYAASVKQGSEIVQKDQSHPPAGAERSRCRAEEGLSEVA